MMFSNLPKDRATSTLKVLETQYGHLKRILGTAGTDWPEKVGIYVFDSQRLHRVRPDGRERARRRRRGIDQRASFGRSTVPGGGRPAGGQEGRTGAAGKRKSRGRRGDEKAGEGSADRSLRACSPRRSARRWCSRRGIHRDGWPWASAPYLASQVEPRSPYYRQLRQTAFANWQQGWPTRANEALGGSDQLTPDGLRSISFALVEAMMSSGDEQGFPAFVNGMLDGGGKA